MRDLGQPLVDRPPQPSQEVPQREALGSNASVTRSRQVCRKPQLTYSARHRVEHGASVLGQDDLVAVDRPLRQEIAEKPRKSPGWKGHTRIVPCAVRAIIGTCPASDRRGDLHVRVVAALPSGRLVVADALVQESARRLEPEGLLSPSCRTRVDPLNPQWMVGADEQIDLFRLDPVHRAAYRAVENGSRRPVPQRSRGGVHARECFGAVHQWPGLPAARRQHVRPIVIAVHCPPPVTLGTVLVTIKHGGMTERARPRPGTRAGRGVHHRRRGPPKGRRGRWPRRRRGSAA